MKKCTFVRIYPGTSNGSWISATLLSFKGSIQTTQCYIRFGQQQGGEKRWPVWWTKRVSIRLVGHEKNGGMSITIPFFYLFMPTPHRRTSTIVFGGENAKLERHTRDEMSYTQYPLLGFGDNRQEGKTWCLAEPINLLQYSGAFIAKWAFCR
jgi:hypothetical protein